mmetsp:Transcript_6506/g.13278  ORF Transcript_6506/g.13278 Transcript_6506/m.13278 type:complete len:210 (+) Transcript_6506:561-1190(+)
MCPSPNVSESASPVNLVPDTGLSATSFGCVASMISLPLSRPLTSPCSVVVPALCSALVVISCSLSGSLASISESSTSVLVASGAKLCTSTTGGPVDSLKDTGMVSSLVGASFPLGSSVSFLPERDFAFSCRLSLISFKMSPRRVLSEPERSFTRSMILKVVVLKRSPCFFSRLIAIIPVSILPLCFRNCDLYERALASSSFRFFSILFM